MRPNPTTNGLFLKRVYAFIRSALSGSNNAYKFLAVLVTLASRICAAYFLATDAPGDGVVYARLARNMLERGVFSLEQSAPFVPTLIRLPGYPLFIAAVYAVFGHDNDTAVRIVQAFFGTGTCVIAAALAYLWTTDETRKHRNANWTFVLISLCPFIVIYTATLLTETLTTFLMASMTLTTTLALQTEKPRRSLFLWILTGALSGSAVLLRPDSGLFALGIGLTPVVSELYLITDARRRLAARFRSLICKGLAFSLVFLLVLVPWTIRNWRVFAIFQPLAPAHAEMPDEFVPRGYNRWLKTWVDDSRFVEPMLWNLDEKPIRIEKLPGSAFDSAEERAEVASLLDRYNKPPGYEDQYQKDDNDPDEEADSNEDQSDADTDQADDASDANDQNANDAADEENGDDESDDDDENKSFVVEMTPEIDAEFERIAGERIARSAFRYYFFLPAKRVAAMWFDSHSVYYPFGGQISPVKDLDADEYQQYWLPLFLVLTWIYTALAIGGAVVLWRDRQDKNLLRWFILLALMCLPRLLFLSSIENPEPRYVVELFVFAAILGGFFLGSYKRAERKAEDSMAAAERSSRLVSLDVFRGMTIAAMTLVNDPGTWSAIYAPLKHAEWNGATPTDLIFPFFLFISGVSITFAFGRRTETGNVVRGDYYKIFRRGFLLFALGVLIDVFPLYSLWTGLWFDPSHVRIMGVLQRIAVCYLVAALVFLHTNWKRQIVIASAILIVYWALMTLVSVPGCEVTTFNDKACNLAAFLDRLLLTENHVWEQSKVYDPEGLLSTLPALATTLFGVLTGHWLRSRRNDKKKFVGMLGGGGVLTVLGWIWNFWFPLNKALWTSSYVLYTAGWALIFLGACYWLIDIKGFRKWSKAFEVFGVNAIALYVGSSIMAAILDFFQLTTPTGETISLQEMIFKYFFLPFADPVNASLLYAVWFVVVWWLLMYIFFRRKHFMKI